MYETKVARYDKDLEEMVMVDDPNQAKRTHHPEIQPAATRIQTYKHKQFGQKYKDAVEQIKRKDHELSVMKKRNTEHGLMTAQLGSVYDVPINVNESQASESTKAGSSVRFSDMSRDFSQTEGATFKPAFKSFYTNAEQEVKYTSINKFEGRSNYFMYHPTNDLKEQKLEAIWFEHKNKQLGDKRRDEETAAYLREWCQARGRMEAEIQRRKEHLNEATNFEKARGFVRTNWKTKNWNPNDDPTQMDSSTDSEDAETLYKDERRDTVNLSNVGSPASKANRSALDSEDRDNYDASGNFTRNNDSMNITHQMSDSKMRKRL